MEMPQRKCSSQPLRPEAQLVARLKAGDRVAFDTIYHIYARRLYAFVASLTDSRHDIEDVVQDTFVNLWTHRQTITAEESLKSLLFAMARNRLVNLLKRTGKVCYTEEIALVVDAPLSADDSSCPLRLLEYNEFEKDVLSTIEQLPDTQRQVVMLSRLEDLSHADIALRLGLSVQTVKNSLTLALKTLRKRFPDKIALGVSILISLVGTF